MVSGRLPWEMTVPIMTPMPMSVRRPMERATDSTLSVPFAILCVCVCVRVHGKGCAGAQEGGERENSVDCLPPRNRRVSCVDVPRSP